MTDSLLQIETPALLIDEKKAVANIEHFQKHCNDAGLSLRPHIKTHKTKHFAAIQRAAGAVGVTCQKISEAEVMARAGHSDILITFNIVGRAKLARLAKLATQVQHLCVTADHIDVVRGLNDTFNTHNKPLNVLVECDTGAGRCGVQSPQQALALAKEITTLAGVQFNGLMTYPAPGNSGTSFIQKTIDKLTNHQIPCPVVSTGGSPDMWSAQTHGVFTEYRIGTYLYNDRSLVERGTCTLSDCAAHIIATVVSTPAADRAVIDAGSKTLTSDLFGLHGHGHIVEHPQCVIETLSEEHGVVRVAANDKLSIGERIWIIPNHICVVSNMFDHAWLQQSDGQLVRLSIDARGCVT